jgi:Methyltransferase domain
MTKANPVTQKDFYIGVVFMACVWVYIEISIHSASYSVSDNSNYYSAMGVAAVHKNDVASDTITTSSSTDYQTLVNTFRDMMPIGIPPGKAIALPSIRVNEEDSNAVDSVRKIYGGKGDKKHLGGFTNLDTEGVSPAVWKYMIQGLGVHSLLDVGCGRGTSTSWFLYHGVDVLCAEGSHDAVEQSLLPDVSTQVVEHDFSRGPWWPEKTYDAVWSVEFLEHVGVNYHYNYISAFRKAALIFVTSSVWGGWHHVEVHNNTWWINKYESYGFRYDAVLSDRIRDIAKRGQEKAPDGKRYSGQHIARNMKVFINPMVASLPKHAHLFPSHGCFYGYGANFSEPVNRPCGEGKGAELESVLPKEFLPLNITQEMDEEWDKLISSLLFMKTET